MPKKESTQDKLSRVKPPRVHITYAVDTDGAIELKEIPFVVGVLGDFSAKSENPLEPFKDPKRKLIEIDRDNFDGVLKGMAPGLAFRVDNKLVDDGDPLPVKLKFEKMQDFHPDSVVLQVDPLRELVEARRRLSDLLSKMDGNDRLEKLLQDVIQNTDQQKQLGASLGIKAPQGSEGEGESK